MASTPHSRAYRKVSKACQRCRRQKLKCDNQRPCVPCTRTGVDCRPPSPEKWKIYGTCMSSALDPQPKRARMGDPPPENNQSQDNGDISRHGDDSNSIILEDGSAQANDQIADNSDRPWRSSSTMSLAFRFYNANSPGFSVTAAIAREQRNFVSSGERLPNEGPGTAFENASTLNPSNEKLGTIRGVAHSSRLAVSDLLELLPDFGVAALLVDTYFDRVHWFMLIFHQDEFRKRWQNLYEIANNRTALKNSDIGFLSVFLMVIAIAMQYVGTHRKRLLARRNFDYEKFGGRIFAAIRSKLLDIVSLESLEAVQTCVLLGTYYLFHGSPGLAWPVCGCGLRIAQALNLHRKISRSGSDSALSVDLRNQNETRKRCWWAIYEIETFCSMSYGYPHSIKDTDCDVEPLDPSAKLQFVQSPTSFDEPLKCDVTLLSYKYFMSKLSVLIKAILADLYGIGSVSNVENPTSSVGSTDDLRCLMKQVVGFDTKLRLWNAEIPSRLQFRGNTGVQTSYSSLDDMDTDIGASSPRFEEHIFQLQALALKLAYENTRILVHRPLLSYKLVSKQKSTQPTAPSWDALDYADPFLLSLKSCREAALNTSEIAWMPISGLVSGTYAATFVSIHAFTSGVTLGILSSVEPLSQESHESKSGLHRLMNIQTRLKDRSPSAVQGLEILQRLTRHVMEKELNAMLDISRPLKSKNLIAGTSSYGSNSPTPRQTVPPAELQQFVQLSPSATQQPSVEPSSQNASDLLSGAESTRNIPSLQNGTDYALSQEVSELDQVMPTSTIQFESQLEQTFIDSSLDWLATDDFSGCEQAWIWCLDNRAFAD
ncbi:uncharacterized protein TRUGW13939_09142 [Talaromyces rugulosus]|uniref:Zn(2)-C6 fungal-type domain-containing protein n=1 Tax=Talaromyces rugulosus TaxID=121627 RepID=A0A7H8R6Z8_TALRU|nr:uncharacterized protein TRUGW13939_09142 [Talaromyces rugulosus]QKX61986.1 hypothetical protein TRUGW13939_09142 [Talaromyces rugulosus]